MLSRVANTAPRSWILIQKRSTRKWTKTRLAANSRGLEGPLISQWRTRGGPTD